MSAEDTVLKHALLEAYRAELRERYSLANVRRFPDLDAVADAKVDAVRDFFLDSIYPASDDRERLDAACDHVGQVFRSPRRLMPLLGTMLGSLLRLGTMLPEAASVTATTLDLFLKTRKLEQHMMGAAVKLGVTPQALEDREATLPKIVAQITDREMVRFRTDVLKLFKSLANTILMDAGVTIMDRALAVMRAKPGVYDAGEVDGFELGRNMLQASLNLYHQLDPDDAHAIIAGIEEIEIDWFDAIKEKAALLK